MNFPKTTNTNYAPFDSTRRKLLGGMALGYAALHGIPLFAATTTTVPDSAAYQDFHQVSLFITGRASLDTVQAQRLWTALQGSDAGLSAQISALARYIDAQKPDPLALQGALDTAKLPFAGVPRKIAAAWFIGVVGEKQAAVCVTYVSSLMYVWVSDQLRPPSYAFGAYGTWSVRPVTAATQPA